MSRNVLEIELSFQVTSALSITCAPVHIDHVQNRPMLSFATCHRPTVCLKLLSAGSTRKANRGFPSVKQRTHLFTRQKNQQNISDSTTIHAQHPSGLPIVCLLRLLPVACFRPSLLYFPRLPPPWRLSSCGPEIHTSASYQRHTKSTLLHIYSQRSELR